MESCLNSVVKSVPKIIIHSDIVIRPGKPKSNHDCVENTSLNSLFDQLFEDVDLDNLECNTQTIFERVEKTDFLGITDKLQSSLIDNFSRNVSQISDDIPCEQRDYIFQIIDENSQDSFKPYFIDLFDCKDFNLDSPNITNNFLGLDDNSTPSLVISSLSAIFSSNSNHSKIDEGLIISDSDAEENSLAIQNSNVSYSDRVILDSKFDIITQSPLSIREELAVSEGSEDIPCGQRDNEISHNSFDDLFNDTQDVTKKNFLGLDENSTQSLEFDSQLFSHFNICNSKINNELPISNNDDYVSATIQNFNLSYFDHNSFNFTSTQTFHANTPTQSTSSKLSNIFLVKNKFKITKQNLKLVSKLKSLGYVLNNFYLKLNKNKPMLEEVDKDWERIGVCFKNVLINFE